MTPSIFIVGKSIIFLTWEYTLVCHLPKVIKENAFGVSQSHCRMAVNENGWKKVNNITRINYNFLCDCMYTVVSHMLYSGEYTSVIHYRSTTPAGRHTDVQTDLEHMWSVKSLSYIGKKTELQKHVFLLSNFEKTGSDC